MIVSKSFLSHFFKKINSFSIEEICNAFFKSGIEVEGYETIIPPTGVVYGIIKKCEKIKESDHLALCEVFIPSENTSLSIVCGAKNAREGLKTVVAKINAKISNGTICICERKLANVTSQGMICGYSELYKSKLLNHSLSSQTGIIELDEEWDCQKDFSPEDLNLCDTIFDLSIPTNRKDLYSVWGLAIELQKNLNNSAEIPTNSIKLEFFNGWKIKKLLLTNNFSCPINTNLLELYQLHAFGEIAEINQNVLKNKFSKELKTITLFGNEINKHEKSPYFFQVLLKEFLNDVYQNNFSCQENVDIPETTIFLPIKKLCSFFNNEVCFIAEIIKKLSVVGFYCKENKDILEVKPPLWRSDLKDFGTFLNELVIHFPIDFIKTSPHSITIDNLKNKNFVIKKIQQISSFFKSNGFLECTTFNLQPKLEVEKNDLFNDLENYTLKNSSGNCDTMRKHGLAELISVLDYNWRQKNELFSIFEIIKVGVGCKSYFVLNIASPVIEKSFALNNTKFFNDIYDLKALIKRVSFILDQKWSFESLKEEKALFIKNKSEQIIQNNNIIGYLGYTEIQNNELEIAGAVIKILISEKDFSTMPQFKESNSFPISFKDFSLEIPETISLKDVVKIIKNTKNCVDCKIIEKYQTDNFVSYLFNCSFQLIDGTLTRQQLQETIKNLESSLREKNIKIR